MLTVRVVWEKDAPVLGCGAASEGRTPERIEAACWAEAACWVGLCAGRGCIETVCWVEAVCWVRLHAGRACVLGRGCVLTTGVAYPSWKVLGV